MCIYAAMSLVMVRNVSLAFGGRTLFDNVNFQINDRDRIGLVGPNGTGKTTLLRIVTGEVSPDGGEVRPLKGIKLGYLPQEAIDVPDSQLLPWILESVPGSAQLRRQIESVEIDLEDARDEELQAELGRRLSHLYAELEHLDTLFSRFEAERILFGLGFGEPDLNRPLKELSGGWQMRASLARLLFQQPDVLLMDEPTNHLDVPSVHWLDDYLGRFGQALVLICHDREFLNRHIKRVVSMEEEGLRSYAGNYDQYVKNREMEEEIAESKSKNQERKVREAQRFIERFRSKATKARQVQSKIKLMDKIELVETYKKRKTIRFSFPVVHRSGRDVLSIENLAKRFAGPPLFKDLTLRVQRGERIAIVGPNGAGKTTLLRIVAGEMQPDAGEVHYGHNVTMSYYAQHQTEQLNPNGSVLEEVLRAAPDSGVGYIRDVCGSFLFSGDDVDKAVGVLSGGEKARVALARLLVAPGNLMLMDEPTNHLDLFSSEVLIKALMEYDGTLLFVSHNQSFVNQLATKVWDLAKGEVEEYPGNLKEYYLHRDRVEQREAEAAAAQKNGTNTDEQPKAMSKEARKGQRRLDAERRSLVGRVVEPIRKELTEVEARIETLETRESEVSKLLADPQVFENPEKSGPLLAEYNALRKELDRLIDRWEKCQARLDKATREMEKELGAA